MLKTFTCRHCGRRMPANPRLKAGQRYCGSKVCQQVRKNLWEQKKLEHDSVYRSKRKQSKEKWRKSKPVYQYQRAYRSSHPDYVEKNRAKQRFRNKNRNESVAMQQIVKTDALNSKSFSSGGFYALFPCENASGKNIVKTDALIVQLAGIQRDAGVVLYNTT